MRVYEAKLSYEATLFEVGPRSVSAPDVVYACMKDVLEVHPMHEVFYVILLNRKNRPLGRVAITSGTATAALAHPREVFRPAIVGGATAIICAHNHPSGVMPRPILCRIASGFTGATSADMRHKTGADQRDFR